MPHFAGESKEQNTMEAKPAVNDNGEHKVEEVATTVVSESSLPSPSPSEAEKKETAAEKTNDVAVPESSSPSEAEEKKDAAADEKTAAAVAAAAASESSSPAN